MPARRKILLSVLIVALTGGIAGYGTFSAFTATTSSAGNLIDSGTVAIGDNDSGAVMYSQTNLKPLDSVSKCVKVTYTGSMDADVKLYTTSSIGTLGTYLTLTITPGTGNAAFPDCSDFVADAGGAIFNNTLANFATSHNSYANGLADNPGTSATKWVTNDAVVYKFTLTVQDEENANGQTTNSHAFTWEARNQ
jgi:hypothetical protein